MNPAVGAPQHKQHRRRNGVCLDPNNVDMTMGYFIPYETTR